MEHQPWIGSPRIWPRTTGAHIAKIDFEPCRPQNEGQTGAHSLSSTSFLLSVLDEDFWPPHRYAWIQRNERTTTDTPHIEGPHFFSRALPAFQRGRKRAEGKESFRIIQKHSRSFRIMSRNRNELTRMEPTALPCAVALRHPSRCFREVFF